MRRLSVIAVGLLVAACGPRQAEPPPFNLASASITLPAETEALPTGPHVDLVASRCTACHSAAMITAQPSLSAEQWKETVTKMREVYRAPVPEKEEAQILAYLETLGR